MRPGWLFLLLAAFLVSKVQTAPLARFSTADTETPLVEKLLKQSIEDTAATETPSAGDIFKELVDGLDLEIQTLNHAMQEHGISATENKSSTEQMTTAAARSMDKAKKDSEDTIRLGFAKKYEGTEELKKPRAPDVKQVPMWLIIFIVLFTAAILLGIVYRYTSKRAKKKQDLEGGDMNEKRESLLQKDDAMYIENEKNSNIFNSSAVTP